MRGDFACCWALCSEEERAPVKCKMLEVQCAVLGADAVFSEPSKLLLEFTVFGCCNLGGSQRVRRAVLVTSAMRGGLFNLQLTCTNITA